MLTILLAKMEKGSKNPWPNKSENGDPKMGGKFLPLKRVKSGEEAFNGDGILDECIHIDGNVMKPLDWGDHQRVEKAIWI